MPQPQIKTEVKIEEKEEICAPCKMEQCPQYAEYPVFPMDLPPVKTEAKIEYPPPYMVWMPYYG